MQSLAVSYDWSDTDTDTDTATANTHAGMAALLGQEELQLLHQIACRLSRPGGNPDDLLQDALEKALKNFGRFQAGTNFTAWIRTIMQRLVIDQWRRRGRYRNVELQDHDLLTPEPEDVPLWAQFDIQDVRQAVSRLREPIRTTFRLSMEGRSYTEIVAMQNIPLATVGTRLRRGRLQVKRLLEQKLLPVPLRAKTPARAARPDQGSAGSPARSSDRHQRPWFSQPHPRASSPTRPRPMQAPVARPSWLPPLRAAIGATSSPS